MMRPFRSAAPPSRRGGPRDGRPCGPVLRCGRTTVDYHLCLRLEGKEAGGASRMIDEILLEHIPAVVPGSARHLVLVEAVRRLYKRDAQEADRQDKLAQR